MLELLSIIYSPVARSVARNLLYHSPKRDVTDHLLGTAPMKSAVEDLVDQSLVVQPDHWQRIQCNPIIANEITRVAERAGRLDGWTTGVFGHFKERSFNWKPRYYHQLPAESHLVRLRDAVFHNAADAFTARLRQLVRDTREPVDETDLFQQIFTRPFDEEWMYSRAPQIRDRALCVLVRDAHRRLAPSDAQGAVLARTAADPSVGNEMLELEIEHLLLTGDLESGTALLGGRTGAIGELFRGCICCIRGNYCSASEHFEKAIQLRETESQKRRIVLATVPGTLYVVSLVGSGDDRRTAKAHEYVDLASRRRPDNDPLHTALRSAIHCGEGKPELAREELSSFQETLGIAPALHHMLIYTVLCWVDIESVRRNRERVQQVEDIARRNGYRWVAAQFGSIADRIGPEDRAQREGLHQLPGVASVPLLEALSDEQRWRRSLAALQRLSESLIGGSGNGSPNRMTWRVAVANGSAEIRPFHQKILKSGRWSAGRSVALKRLCQKRKPDYLTPDDLRICNAIEEMRTPRGTVTYKLDVAEAAEALVGHPLVFRLDERKTRVEVVGSEPELSARTDGELVRIRFVPDPPTSGDVAIEQPSRSRVSVSRFTAHHRAVFAVVGRQGLELPTEFRESVARALSSVSKLVTVHSDIAGSETDAIEKPADPTPRMHLTPYGGGLRVEPHVCPFINEGPVYSPGRGGETVFAISDGQRVRTQRDLGEESRRLDAVVASCSLLRNATWDGAAWLLADPQDCLEALEQLHLLGGQVVIAWPEGTKFRIRNRVSGTGLSLRIRKARNWFMIDGSVELDEGLVMGLQELIEQVRTAPGRFLPLGDNQFVALSDRFRKQIDDLVAYTDVRGKGLRCHPARAHALEGIVENAGRLRLSRFWKDSINRFRKAQTLDPEVPSTLQAQLRDYQLEGYRWAIRLAACGAGACLADDMGLGKTIQALTVVLARAPNGPTLVVAPTSVCANWIDEARRFTPTLRLLRFRQANRSRMLRGLGPYDMLVCSYGLLHHEAESLAEVPWNTVVLDEAQAIKNRGTMRSRAAMGLTGEFRMITTGTPIENHLSELWNLFSFVNPGLLGSFSSFNAKFAVPIHQRGSRQSRMRLKRLIQPFILRRTKAAVLDELPPRTEIVERTEMTLEERSLYEAIRRNAVDSLAVGAGDTANRHLRVLAEITRLRRACCHPRLVVPDTPIESSKLERFLEIVGELLDNGHKALVFSQFVSHLGIVRSHLDRRGVDYRYLDGSTPSARRKHEVDGFQAGKGDLFLISLRAGGQGLNLTAADFVIHLDPWWNPAVEDQASDRAHRIGQTRPVTIFRLVMKDTIEEKIVDLHKSKRDLADSLLEGTDMSGKMSAEELLALLQAS